MLKNFFSIAFRNLLKNKAFSIINISGLSIGMAASVLIFMVIAYQKSFDQFHENKDRIYEAWNKATFSGTLNCWSTTPKPLARAMEKDIPEVECAARVNWPSTYLFSIGDKRIKASGNIVDTTFLKIFTFPLKQGDAATALNDIYSIIVTETFAKRLFGTEDVMGKFVKIDNKDNFKITGVMKELPTNTRFSFDYLLPWSFYTKTFGNEANWGNNSTRTYALLKPNVSLDAANEKMKIIKGRYDEKESKTWQMFLYPIDRWRLYSRFKDGVEQGGMVDTLRIFGIIAVFLLLIACINFMNLSTARSEKRAKEVGIRKVVGARKFSLISHFIGESVLLATLAGIIALGLIYFSLPAFNKLINEKMTLNLNDFTFWIKGGAFILFTGILAGSYPAFFMSAFNPSAVLKGTFKAVNALITPRKLLVVLQFTFAIILIICTSIVKQQLDHAKDRESGYDRDKLVYTSMEGDISKNYELIRNELLSSGVASNVCKTSSPITQGWSDSWGYKWEGMDPKDEKMDFDIFNADQDIIKTAGFTLLEGRDFNLKEFATDSAGMIMNESALKIMKFEKPLGQLVKNGDETHHVIGVIKDFILQSPYQPMRPMLITSDRNWFNIIHYKLNKDHAVADNLKNAAAIFNKYNPEYPFDYKFVDEEYSQKFRTEQRMGTMSSLFAGLTIFISCLGLFGLATYMAENRIKEIGVRKVLGASVASITSLLSKDFLKLIMFSFIVACPVAWWLMHKWLLQYPYRIDVQWQVFAFAGGLSLMIALFTISYQSIKAAMANPVRSLRTE
ncbi:MAG: ABC transporter permease [Saprospiraceae bacterium]